MDYAKLDAALQDLLAESELTDTPLESVLVSVVLAPDARRSDRERLQALLNEVSLGQSVATGMLTSQELATVSENPAVLTVQLARRLRPKIRRRA